MANANENGNRNPANGVNALEILMTASRKEGSFNLNVQYHQESDGNDSPYDGDNHTPHYWFQQNLERRCDDRFRQIVSKVESAIYTDFHDERFSLPNYPLYCMDEKKLLSTAAKGKVNSSPALNDDPREIPLPPSTNPPQGVSLQHIIACYGSKVFPRKNKYSFHDDKTDRFSNTYIEESMQSDNEDGREGGYVPIIGFLLGYCNGLEIEVGCLKGETQQEKLQLRPGESIVKVAQQFPPYTYGGESQPYARSVFVFTSHRHHPYRFFGGGDQEGSKRDESNQIVVPRTDGSHGTLLLEWDFQKKCLKSWSGTQPPSEGESDPTKNLVSKKMKALKLAHYRLLGRSSTELRAKYSKSLDRIFDADMRCLLDCYLGQGSRLSRLKEVELEEAYIFYRFFHGKKRCAACGETKMKSAFFVKQWRLDTRQRRCKDCCSEDRHPWHHMDTEELRPREAAEREEWKEHEREFQQRRLQIRKEKLKVLAISSQSDLSSLLKATNKVLSGIRYHLSILSPSFEQQLQSAENKLSQLRQEFQQQLTCPQDENRAIMCNERGCLELLCPSHVRKGKRCSAENCFARSPVCGCKVQECKRCVEPFCPIHMKSHEDECLLSFPHRCGWKKGSPFLHRQKDFCGSRIQEDMKQQCLACGVQCCSSCGVKCHGVKCPRFNEGPIRLYYIPSCASAMGPPQPKEKPGHACEAFCCQACKGTTRFLGLFQNGHCPKCDNEMEAMRNHWAETTGYSEPSDEDSTYEDEGEEDRSFGSEIEECYDTEPENNASSFSGVHGGES